MKARLEEGLQVQKSTVGSVVRKVTATARSLAEPIGARLLAKGPAVQSSMASSVSQGGGGRTVEGDERRAQRKR